MHICAGTCVFFMHVVHLVAQSEYFGRCVLTIRTPRPDYPDGSPERFGLGETTEFKNKILVR